MIRRADPVFRHQTAKHIGEELHTATLSSGLSLMFAPRPAFASRFALFSTRYGSVDSAWREGRRLHRVPDGIAHYLEHQLFKKRSGDLTERFTANGAYCNAMTTHAWTAYHFEGVSNFWGNLDLLLELCLTPWFDRKLVDLERGIITQEIVSYRDHPHWVNYQSLLEGLYSKHPVRIDIAGDESTVARITPELLASCHRRFYHPRNCVLIVSGDLDPLEVLRQAEDAASRHFDGRAFEPVSPAAVKEPPAAFKSRVERRFGATAPRLLIGYKDSAVPGSGEEMVRRETEIGILLDLLFGRGTEFFDALYGEGVVSGSFSASYHVERDFGYAVIGGETFDPDELERRLDARLDEVRGKGLSASDLERKKRKIEGRYLRNFESAEATAMAHHGAWAMGVNLFAFPAIVKNIGLAGMERCLREVFNPHARCASLLSNGSRTKRGSR